MSHRLNKNRPYRPAQPPRAPIGSSDILGASDRSTPPNPPGASERKAGESTLERQAGERQTEKPGGVFLPEKRPELPSQTPLAGVFPAISADPAGSTSQRLLAALKRSGREPQIRDVIARASLLQLLNTQNGRTKLSDAFEALFLTGQVVKGKKPNTVRLGENAPILRST